MNNTSPVYNRIGVGYNNTRKADPYLASRILHHLAPNPNGRYLDIGCGTGNYLRYCSELGYAFIGVDPSDTMLDTARSAYPSGTFVQGTAENIPFDDNYFNGAMAILTLHHWKNRAQGITELHRVLQPDSKIVFLSFTGRQMYGYWLMQYFPEMIKQSADDIPTEDEMKAYLTQAGFADVVSEKYFVRDDLQDLFLYSHKTRPEQYLNPDFRKGISSFAAFANANEVAHGLQQLERDIESGAITQVMKQYENTHGDYMFYSAVKK